jgi:hypothetical protein
MIAGVSSRTTADGHVEIVASQFLAAGAGVALSRIIRLDEPKGRPPIEAELDPTKWAATAPLWPEATRCRLRAAEAVQEAHPTATAAAAGRPGARRQEARPLLRLSLRLTSRWPRRSG